jgi:hypothetical protein
MCSIHKMEKIETYIIHMPLKASLTVALLTNYDIVMYKISLEPKK